MKIGIFDSGIGGLTVLKEFIAKYPNCEYVYYGDTLHLPYGDKTKDELLELVTKIIDFFIEQQVDIIVIACGTVSSTIYKELCNLYSIRLLNIINFTVNKVKEDNIKDIAVLATKKTIDSHIFSEELNNINVMEIACPKFVPFIEKNIGNIDDILNEYLVNIKDNKINNIVLGCTHYPLLKEKIRTYLGYDVNFYDMGKIITSKLYLTQKNFKLHMYFSYVDDNLLRNINKIIDVGNEIDELVL